MNILSSNRPPSLIQFLLHYTLSSPPSLLLPLTPSSPPSHFPFPPGLLSVPAFKALTGLPPYLGMLAALGVLWTLTDAIHAGEGTLSLHCVCVCSYVFDAWMCVCVCGCVCSYLCLCLCVYVRVCEYFVLFEIPLLYDIWKSVTEHYILSYFHSIPVDFFLLLYICYNFIMYFLIALSTPGKEREELMAPAAFFMQGASSQWLHSVGK